MRRSVAGVLLAVSLAGCNAIAGIGAASVRESESGIPDDASDDSAGDDAGDDAADAAACLPIGVAPLPKTGGAACPAESGTCYPHDLTGWSPSWHPSVGAKLGKCTAPQIDSYYAACRGPNWTQAQCTAFGKQNAPCAQCIESNIASPRYGVIVFGNETNWINIAGCVALVEPCNQPCAEALNALQQCSLMACDSQCALTTQAEAFQCEQASWTCAACGEFEPIAGCMAQVKGDGHPAFTTCGLADLGDVQKVFTDLARFACGS